MGKYIFSRFFHNFDEKFQTRLIRVSRVQMKFQIPSQIAVQVYFVTAVRSRRWKV